MTKRFGDFFAGIGLVEAALLQDGWTPVFANDNDPRKLEIYAANFSSRIFQLDDVFHLSPGDLPQMDMAWASFPCIDLSLAGNLRGLAGEHSSAFWGFAQAIERMADRPHLIVAENVLGLLTHKNGEALRVVVATLNDLGYTTDVVLIDAIHFVPQSRPRLFVIGIAGNDHHREEVVQDDPIRPHGIQAFRSRNADLNWTNLGMAPLPERSIRLTDLLEDDLNEDLWWSRDRTKRLIDQISPAHLSKINALGDKGISHFPIYRRIRPQGCRAEARFDGVAGCLRTARGGSSRQILLEMRHGKTRARFMTPREYARLQGVDDGFKIEVRSGQALHGLGDAVCVPAVRWLSQHLLSPSLAARERPGREAVTVRA